MRGAGADHGAGKTTPEPFDKSITIRNNFNTLVTMKIALTLALAALLATASAGGLRDTDCHTLKDESTCDKDGCYWCKSAAVPSACYTADEVKKLPPGVFACGTSQETLLGADPDPCNAIKDMDSCAKDTQDGCTWCKSAAVPSACYSADQAKKLPPAVFVCGQAADSYLSVHDTVAAVAFA